MTSFTLPILASLETTAAYVTTAEKQISTADSIFSVLFSGLYLIIILALIYIVLLLIDKYHKKRVLREKTPLISDRQKEKHLNEDENE